MHTTTKIVLAGVLMGAAVAGGTATANAQYYPPPYGYGYGGPTWNGCPPGYTVREPVGISLREKHTDRFA